MDLTFHLVIAKPDSRNDDMGRLVCSLLSGRHNVSDCLLDINLLTSKYLTPGYISAVAFAMFVSITEYYALVLIIVHFFIRSIQFDQRVSPRVHTYPLFDVKDQNRLWCL
jgi:hypothetical protein